MKSIAVFLRGINVNGISIKMEELKSAVEAIGYKSVKTILASGNFVASVDNEDISCEEHKSRIEKQLSMHFGYEANVIIKSAEQIAAILDEAGTHEVPEDYHHYILLTGDNGIAEKLRRLFEECRKAEHERLILGTHGIYWIAQKGDTLKSDFGKQCLGKKEYKNLLTSRTMNTILKVAKCLDM